MEIKKKRILDNFIGDKAFYKATLVLLLPMVVQQGITYFVGLLDNIMVGALCTESISGVAIVNQLMTVFQFSLFGALSGASIYGAQFAGVQSEDGIRHTFRFKFIVSTVITVICIIVLVLFGKNFIGLFIHAEPGAEASAALTVSEAEGYLKYTYWGMIPFMISQCFSSTLRETGDTVAPMKTSLISIGTNLVLNYVLIYGHFGLPEMGVRGAALATVIARVIEAAALVFYTYRHNARHPFINGAFSSLYIPRDLIKRIFVTALPILANEVLWSIVMTMISQSYSVRGLMVVAANNITTTVWQAFSVVIYAMGSAISIICGHKLGANDIEGAIRDNTRLLTFSAAMHMVIGLIIIACSGLIPMLYNVEPEVRELTRKMLVVAGCCLWLYALGHGLYFTIRCGGRTVLTFFFDCVFTFVFIYTTVHILCYYTDIPVHIVYLCQLLCNALKVLLALPILLKGSWARNIIKQ